MKTLLLSSLVLLAGLVSCKGTDGATSKPTAKVIEGYDSFGAGVESLEAVAAAEVLANPTKYDGKEVRVSGDIHSVCVKKGCWMRIGSEEKNVFVKFQDYGFFVPTDAHGRTAVMEGVITVKEIPLAEAKHYLEDEGKHEEAKALKVAPKEVTFLATGVALRK